MSGARIRIAGVLLRRPWLLPLFLSSAWAFRSRHWYRRAPFLPLPSEAYMRWRLDTAYGDPEADPPVEDLLHFLRWARAMRREMRRR